MDWNAVQRVVADYVDTFAACGRGKRDVASLLDYYGVPLLLSTDDDFSTLTSADQVIGWAQQQLDVMRAADFDHIDAHDFEIVVLNRTSGLYRGLFSRHRTDGSEISRLSATYLVTEGSNGRRISALVVNSS